MLGNTLTVTLGATPYVMTKINQDSYASEYLYRDADEQVTARIRHTKVSKGGVSYDRHNFELRWLLYATPTAVEVNRLFYFVVEQLPTDMSKDLAIGGCGLATASSAAFLSSLQGWES